MTTLIADFSCYQSNYHGDPADINQLYNPAFWTVPIDFTKVKGHGAGVIIRVGLGTRLDPCFDRYLAGLKANGIPWGIYHAFTPGYSVPMQAQLVHQWCPELPPLGVWEDFEIKSTIYPAANQMLVLLDSEYQTRAGVYSNGPDLNEYFSEVEQAALSFRPLWIAGYPNFWPPLGWNKGQDYTWHQFSDNGTVPGVPRPCDLSVLNPKLESGQPAAPDADVSRILAHLDAIRALMAA